MPIGNDLNHFAHHSVRCLLTREFPLTAAYPSQRLAAVGALPIIGFSVIDEVSVRLLDFVANLCADLCWREGEVVDPRAAAL